MPRTSFGTALLAGLLVCLLWASPAEARSRRKPAAASSGSFSYYMLVLSYAPDFCDQPTGRKDPRECGAGRHVGFVVHGLWPQGENSRGPENCGGARPVAQSLVQTMLRYIPTESLIQHEWTAHGSCSGLSASDYFAALRKARDSIRLPGDLNEPREMLRTSPAQVEAKLAAANPGLPRGSIRVTCYRDEELQEVRFCFAKDLTARPCGSSAGSCPARGIRLLPVR